MKFFVIGCGRVGSELAFRLYEDGHHVVVIDPKREAFNSLHPEFRGMTIEGNALAQGVLERAGILEANGIAAVTNVDTLNAVVAHTARIVYKVPIVVARNYDPKMLPVLKAFGVQVISTTTWGAQRFQELLLEPAYRTIFSTGNGDVEIYELLIPPFLDRKPLAEFLHDNSECLPVALTHRGHALIPNAETILNEGDILAISATIKGIRNIHARLESGGEA